MTENSPPPPGALGDGATKRLLAFDPAPADASAVARKTEAAIAAGETASLPRHHGRSSAVVVPTLHWLAAPKEPAPVAVTAKPRPRQQHSFCPSHWGVAYLYGGKATCVAGELLELAPVGG